METGEGGFNHTVAGGWLGSYYYDRDAQPPTRFEATFDAVTTTTGAFRGAILDDGPLGEAVVGDGVQTGRAISFVKTFTKPPRGYVVPPVQYTGEMSEDGRMMTGTWEVAESGRGRRGRKSVVRGLWEARRTWSAEANEETEGAGELFRRELELVAP